MTPATVWSGSSGLLGPPNTLATEQAKILLEYNIDLEFAADVLAEAEAVPETVQPEDLGPAAPTCAGSSS